MNSGTREMEVPPGLPKVRLDQWLQRELEGPSRTEIQHWIRSGQVRVNGEAVAPGLRLQAGMRVVVIPPPSEEEAGLKPEDLPLEILHEDTSVIAINKAPGLVVHPAPGHPGGTVLNAMLFQYPDLASAGPPGRPGLAHRLDTDTSGVLLFARTPDALEHLQRQFKARETRKRYQCICRGIPHPVAQTVDRPIGRHPVHRQKRSIDGVAAKSAISHFRMTRGVANGEAAFLDIEIETGRTHQIRVHLDSLQHPILGDPLYGGRRSLLPEPWPKAPRLLLHAQELHFSHPQTGKRMQINAPLPPDFETYLNLLL